GERPRLPLGTHQRAGPLGPLQLARPFAAAMLLPLPLAPEHAVAARVREATEVVRPVFPPRPGGLASAAAGRASAAAGTAGRRLVAARIVPELAARAHGQPLDGATRRRLAARELDPPGADDLGEVPFVRHQPHLDAGAGGGLVDDEEPLPVVPL